MSERNDRNYVSTMSWFGMMFVMAIPLVGFVMMIVWAFTGDNETRKNYFRALLLWMLVGLVLAAGFFLLCLALGTLPFVLSHAHA